MDDPSSGERRSPARALAGVVASVLFSALVLAAVWRFNDLDSDLFVASLGRVDAVLLAAVCAASALFHVFVGAHKIRCILRSLGVAIDFREALALRLGADPLRMLVPFRAGELAQMLYVWRTKDVSMGRASGMTLFDRALNLFGTLFWLAVGVALLPEAFAGLQRWLGGSQGSEPLLRVGAPLVVVSLALILGLWTPIHGVALALARRVHPRVEGFLDGVVAPLRELSTGRKLFFLGYGVVFQLRPLLVCWALLSIHGVDVGVDRLLARASATVLAGQVPGALAGAGPREAALVELFQGGGAAPEVLFAVGLWMTLAVNVIPSLIGLPWTLWFLRSLRRR